MPAIIRKTFPVMLESRREILHAISWQVRSTGWNPPTDIYESEDYFTIRVEIAGMKETDFEVAVEDSVLMITGNRHEVNERRAYHQMEIRFGKFEIVVEIPVPVQLDDSDAEYKDGFLMINLQKAKPNQIRAD